MIDRHRTRTLATGGVVIFLLFMFCSFYFFSQTNAAILIPIAGDFNFLD